MYIENIDITWFLPRWLLSDMKTMRVSKMIKNWS